MERFVFVLCMWGFAVMTQVQGQTRFNSCKTIENCFIYYEGECTNEGERLVCLQWTDEGFCSREEDSGGRDNYMVPTSTPTDVNICLAHNFSSKEPIPAHRYKCTTPYALVKAGHSVTFGIQDGEFLLHNVDSGFINITNYIRRQAYCQGYTTICEASGNRDIGLTFIASPCLQTTSTTTAPTTTPSCECDPWINWGPCSTSCGQGVREQRRICRNCPPDIALTTYIQCVGNPECSVDGNWGEWTQWTQCSVSCGSGGQQTRSRSCDNPSPSGPNGLPCSGSNEETQLCVTPSCRRSRIECSQQAMIACMDIRGRKRKDRCIQRHLQDCIDQS